MGAAYPQPREHQDDEGPHHLVSHARFGPPAQFGLGILQAVVKQQPLLELVQQIEKPQAEADLGIDEITKAQHEKIEPKGQENALAKHIDGGPEDDLGEPGEVVVQRKETHKDHWDGKADPHGPTAEKGL